jgi:WD40-like Beta Propeller Repeat
MPRDYTLDALLGALPTLEAHEGVAIVQQLIAAHADVRRGKLTFDSVRIAPDGSVTSTGDGATANAAEIGELLDAIVRRHGTRVGGPLRYTIVRALGQAAVPPFASVEELSAALGRHEQGAGQTVVRDLYARAAASSAPVMAEPSATVGASGASTMAGQPPRAAAIAASPLKVDRRRQSPTIAQLRRQLREADEELFRLRLAQREERSRPVPAATARHEERRRASSVSVDTSAHAALPLGAPFTSQPSGPEHGARWIAVGVLVASLAFIAGYAMVRRPAAVGERAAVATTGARTSPLPSEPKVPAAAPLVAARRPASVAAGENINSPGDAQLERGVARWAGPSFSPSFDSNGTALFFHTGNSKDAASALESSDLLSGDLRVMTILDDGAKNFHVQPSPDGTRVAFDSDRDGERGVYVAKRDGTDVRRVSGAGYAAVPTWSPDGTTLAFVRAETDRPRVWNLWLLRLSTGETRRLTSFKSGQTWSASWFADGRRVSYTHEDRVIVHDLVTNATREYVTPVPGRAVRTPAVSPDGTHVIFQVARSGAWLLDVEAGSMRCVLTDPTAEEFAWSPDGRRVAFHSRRDGQWGIWVMAPS